MTDDDDHGTAVVDGGDAQSQDDVLPDTTSGYERLPDVEVLAEAMSGTANAMEEFNGVVWQIAKFIWYVAAIFFAIATMFIMYHAAKFVVGL